MICYSDYFTKGIDIWNPKLFGKNAVVVLRGYVCDIGKVIGYGGHQRVLKVSSYSGYSNVYSIDLDELSGSILDIHIISDDEFNCYSTEFDKAKTRDENRDVCYMIQLKMLRMK